MNGHESVSIIVCTRNRAESLGNTLQSFAALDVPHGWAVELLVVDNGSTDDTARTVANASIPRIRVLYVYEGRPGQCNARNAGIAASSGNVILFTDDDARPLSNWLSDMCLPILRGETDAVQGGFTTPPELARLVDEGSHGPNSSDSWDPSNPYLTLVGLNMAFHRRALTKV